MMNPDALIEGIQSGTIKTSDVKQWQAQASGDKANIAKWTFKEIYDKLKDEWEKNWSVSLKKAMHSSLTKMSKDLAKYLVSGNKGQKPMFIKEGWGKYLSNTADETAGKFIEGLGKTWSKFLCGTSPSAKAKITLGLVSVKDPPKPKCSFLKMLNNWDKSMKNKNFLNEFKDMFTPTGNHLGISLTLHGMLLEEMAKGTKVKELERKENEGWLRIPADKISDKFEDIPLSGKKRTESLQRLYEKNWGEYTGNALIDALNIFLNQLLIELFNKLMASLGKDAKESTSPYQGDYGGIYNEEGQVSAGSAAAEERFKGLFGANFSVRGDYDILTELSTCPDPQNAGPTNCVIGENMRHAIAEKMTVGEALMQGYLNKNGAFGFFSDNYEAREFQENYPYRSIVILRKYRIVPVGWELAAQYLKEYSAIGAKSLMDITGCYDPNDAYDSGYNETWCRGLVDPGWVLKAPQNFCKRQGYGPIIASQDVVGEGVSSRLQVSRLDNYCADEQSCIKEKSDGRCDFYGYCTEERRIWKFDEEECEPRFNTCDTFSRDGEKTISYLMSTLDYSGCSADYSGCDRFAVTATDPAVRDPFDAGRNAVSWFYDGADPDLGMMYFDSGAGECDAAAEGCQELIRLKSGLGANLIVDSGFESDPAGNWSAIWAGASRSAGGYNSGYALGISSPVSGVIDVSGAGYPVAGMSFTLSVYSRDCGSSSVISLGGDPVSGDYATTTLLSGDDWTRSALTYSFPARYVPSGGMADNQAAFGIEPDSAACRIDNIKLERARSATSWSDYGKAALAYERILPDYMSSDCYNNALQGDYALRQDAPAICRNFARLCNASEAGCELYSSARKGFSIPARLSDSDYCPGECVGYDSYVQSETAFDSRRFSYFIPDTAKSCSPQAVGCDEFTNIDKIKEGGEKREYYVRLRQCVKPDDTCQEFYTWEGTGEAGMQLRAYALKFETNPDNVAEPVTTDPAADAACTAATYNLPPDDPAYDPDCREFYNQAGQVTYHLLSYTVTCADNCHPYRRTEKNTDPSITEFAQCSDSGAPAVLCSNVDPAGVTNPLVRVAKCWDAEAGASTGVCRYCKNGGYWSPEHQSCLYDAIPGEGIECTAAESGCRTYAGSNGANIKVLVVSDFEGEADDFDGWTGIGGTTLVKNPSVSLFSGGNALEVRGGERRISLPVGGFIKNDKSYSIRFLGRAPQDAVLQAFITNGQGTATATFTSVRIEHDRLVSSGGWGDFRMNLEVVNRDEAGAVTGLEELIIAGNADYYIDNIVLTEVADRYYLVKNSWKDNCDWLDADPLSSYVGELYYSGCDLYYDREKNEHSLFNFSNLCPSDSAGCEAMILTRNSNSPFAETLPEGADSSFPTVDVPADRFIFAIYDQKKECSSDEQGCRRVGREFKYADEEPIFHDGYLIDDPDNYEESLCPADAVHCDTFKSGQEVHYFKDPGPMACSWDTRNARWQKQKVGRCAWDSTLSDNRVCTQQEDCYGGTACNAGACPAGQKCVEGYCYYYCRVDSNPPASVAECNNLDFSAGRFTLGNSGSGRNVPYPLDDFAGICPASQAGCTEYIDPLSLPSTNLIINPGLADMDGDGKNADGWTNSASARCVVNTGDPGPCEQDVQFDRHTAYVLDSVSGDGVGLSCASDIYAMGPDNALSATRTISVAGGDSLLFYSNINTSCRVTGANPETIGGLGDTVTLKEAMIGYQKEESADRTTCNGRIDESKGCVLFNERAQEGSLKSALAYDADKSGDLLINDPAKNDSNQILSVANERICDKWLACKSAATVKSLDGRMENACFDIGLCDSLDTSGQCDNFIKQITHPLEADIEAADRGLDIFSVGGLSLKNATGYVKAGKVGAKSPDMAGLYQYANMKQVAELAEVPNGNFEYYEANLQPIGWYSFVEQTTDTDDTGDEIPSNFFVISSPAVAESYKVDYPAEGGSFIAYSADNVNYSPTSEMFDIEPNKKYMLSAYVNTLNLKSTNNQPLYAYIQLQLFDSFGVLAWEPILLKITNGQGWKRINTMINLGNYGLVTRARVHLGSGFNQTEICSDVDATHDICRGNIFMDDIRLSPALEVRPDRQVVETCRLYPRDDSLSCDYYDGSGARYKGIWGYCLEYDRAPGNPNACLQWWPVDRIKGDGIEEGPGYNLRVPAYYCLGVNSYCEGGSENMDANFYCSRFVSTVTPAGNNKFWSGRVYKGSDYEVFFAEARDNRTFTWYENHNLHTEPLILNVDRNAIPFGSAMPPYPTSNPFKWDSDSSRIGKQPLPIYPQNSDKDGLAQAGTPYVSAQLQCTRQIQCRRDWGSNETQNGCEAGVGSWDQGEGGGGGCWLGSSDADEMGIYYIRCPDGYNGVSCAIAASGSGSAGYRWDSTHTVCEFCRDDGDVSITAYLTCEISPENNSIQSGSDINQAKEGLKRIFAQSYNFYEWVGSSTEGYYRRTTPTASTDWQYGWTVPNACCNNSSGVSDCVNGYRDEIDEGNTNNPANIGDYCAIPPRITNIIADQWTGYDSTIGFYNLYYTKSKLLNLKFNTLVDANQLPMTSLTIDWGDNDATSITGVEMRDFRDPSNPHNFYHLYDYWDLRAKWAVNQGWGRNNVFCGVGSITPGGAFTSGGATYALASNPYVNDVQPSAGSDPNYYLTPAPTYSFCMVKPKIKIKDNWDWCNGGTARYDCDDWVYYANNSGNGWIIVTEK